mmetsp:Transcript_34883/g.81472  ORF Transcript_34883/g.81472 Transcript_34883/m.81472 type:complete len:148 (+) Transcript_34883:237-680(+)
MNRVVAPGHRLDADCLRAYRWPHGVWPWSGWSTRTASLALARCMPWTEFPAVHGSPVALKDCIDWANRFGMPCVLVWGTQDPLVGRSVKRVEDAFTYSGSRVDRVEVDVGHFVPEEAPAHIVDAIHSILEEASLIHSTVSKEMDHLD